VSHTAQTASQASPASGGSRQPGPGRRQGPGKGLWIALGVLALAGGLYLALAPSLPPGLGRPELWWGRLVRPLLGTLAFIAGGLLVGQVIEGLGWTARLGVVVWPLVKRARLPQEAGAAFSAAFASGVAANTLLFTSWQEGRLNKRQLVLANLLNASLPAFFLHLPTTFFVVYAMMSQVALLYFGLTLLAALLRCLGVIALSRLILPPARPLARQTPAPAKPWRQVLADTWPKFLGRLKRLLLIILPVYLAIFVLAQGGFFTWLGQALARFVSSEVVSMEAMSVVIFGVMAEFTSGFAAAGALLHAGSLGIKEVVVALLIGNVVATPVRALRHQLPHYMGIYSPGLGSQLLIMGQGARVLSVLMVTLLFAWWC
jgi:hypothetical protein